MEKDKKNKSNTTKKSTAKKSAPTKKSTAKKSAPVKKSTAKKSTTKKVNTSVQKKETTKKPEVTIIKKEKKFDSSQMLKSIEKIVKEEKQALMLGGIIIAVAILFYNVGFAIAEKPIPQLSDGTEILAEIDGKTFTADSLYEKMKGRVGFGVLLEEIDDYIVRNKVEETEEITEYAHNQLEQLKMQLTQQGEDFDSLILTWGFEDEDDLLDYFKYEKMRTEFINNYIKSTFTERQLKDYYNNEIDGAMNVRHILIQPDFDSAESEEEFTKAEEVALNKANDLIQRLNDGEDFVELAKLYSNDLGTADEGGLFEGFTKNQVVPEFWEGSISLEDGEFSQTPVQSQFGYHIIYRINQEEKADFDDIIDMIKNELLEEKRFSTENLEETIMIEIRDEYDIVINDPELLRSYNDYKKQMN